MNENTNQRQITSPDTEPTLTEWVVPQSAPEARKQIASLFESFLVGKMQSGAIEVDPAKQMAELFVKIFQDATSNERLESALSELNKQNDQLLKSFYLRVSELRLKPVRSKLYDFMLELVHLGKINEARDLYARYESGAIKDTYDLLEVEKQMVSNQEINAAAEKIAGFLSSQNKMSEATQLREAITNGTIKTLEDLKPWETIISSEFKVQSSELNSEFRTPNSESTQPPELTTQNSQMNFGQRVWEGIHRLDKNLRKRIGMN